MSVHVGGLQYTATQTVTLTGEEVKDLPVVTYLSGDDVRIESVQIKYTYDFARGAWMGHDPSVSTRKYKKNGEPYDARPSSATAYGPRRGGGGQVWVDLLNAHRPTSVLQLVVGEF